jgi:hypothetical protein
MKSQFAAIIAAIAGATPATAAPPRHWFILWGADGQCHAASQVIPAAPTPEKFHIMARAEGNGDDVRVVKDDAGNVLYVTTQIAGEDGALVWFPDAAGCEVGKKLMIKLGSIPDMNDLK